MILDCTLRDGGYYVRWDFDHNTVRKYLAAMATSKIDVIEVGFRFLPTNKFLGAFAYSTDDYLNLITLPDDVPIAVMINASELISSDMGVEATVNQLFRIKSSSPVDIVRVAVVAKDIEACRKIVDMLSGLGYRVFLNLMQVDKLKHVELVRISKSISSWGGVEVLYLADSFGSMEPESVVRVVKSVTQGWSGHLGIHAHDNKGLALQNTLAAYKCGVQYLDSTLCGMGRGAGNTKTEYLLVELMRCETDKYLPDALFPLALQEFNKLQQEYRWGTNIYYYLSAVYGIHPTYIQEMLGDERYDTDQILSSINFLKSASTSFFSFENMLKAAAGVEGDEYGTWSAKDWIGERTVVIIGSGPSTKKYINELQLFINQYKPFVLCLNINENIPSKIVDAYVACHETRILIESDRYSNLDKPIIIPLSRVPESIRRVIQGANVFDYGLRVEEGCFDIAPNGCVLASPLALSYAIAVATTGGAGKILLVGIDGYRQSDKRQQEMIDLLDRYRQNESSVSMVAITPTTFPIVQGSIFEPFKL